MKFSYKIFNSEGVIVDGFIDGVSEDEVIGKLQKNGNIVIEVKEVEPVYNESFWEMIENRISEKDIVIATKQLATLFGGGIQILRSFRLLASETSHSGLKKRFDIIADDIQSGISISKALMKHNDIFNSFFISMVYAGEESGKLKETLQYLADYLERNFELKQKTKKALTYPIFVIVTFILVMIIMSIFVLPKMVSLLLEQGQEVPWYTEFIYNFSNIILNYWWVILPVIFFLIYYLLSYSKTKEGKAYLDTIKLRIPIIKNFYQKLYVSRIADNIETMLSAGVPIIQTLQITADVVDNYVFKIILQRVESKISQGKLLSNAFAEESLIPNIMIQMTRIGEETGQLGYMLKNMSKFYKRELEQTIETTLALLEPILIIIMGIAVGILISSVLLPMYDVATNIQ